MGVGPQPHADLATGASYGRDSLGSFAAIGVIAYVGETIGHEALGHGAACLMSGGHVTLLAPLFMRCSVQSLPMVAAGPALNFVLAALFGFAVSWRRSGSAVDLCLWLSCAFNLLVACGYLAVGGATGFGDWGVLFAGASPPWTWRVPAMALGVVVYLAGLRILALLYTRSFGTIGLGRGRLRARTLLPGAAAAIVAVAAELAGGRLQIGNLALAVGCTLFVGWSLMSIDNARFQPDRVNTPNPTDTAQSVAWIAAGVAVAAVFVFVVGRAPA